MSIPKLFNIETDVPTCSGTPDGTCLAKAQKEVLAKIHAGVRNKKGEHLYVNFLWDAGISGEGNSLIDFVLGFDMDSDAQKIFATDSVYRESAMSFMTPPKPTVLSKWETGSSGFVESRGDIESESSFVCDLP